MKKHTIKITGLPKVSMNAIYAGIHYRKRKKLKDDVALIVKSQCKKRFKSDKKYGCVYTFHFKKNALDAMNTAFMAKMVEDVIFEKDTPDIVLSNTLQSRKSDGNYLVVEVHESINTTKEE